MLLAALLLALGILVFALDWLFPGVLAGGDARASTIYYVAWIALLGAGLLASFRGQWRQAGLSALAWVAVALILVGGYAYREELSSVGRRVLGELVPSLAIQGEGGEVVLRRGLDGHFHADGRIDGVQVRFLVDTGASLVALSAADARRLGIDLDKLDFARPVETANGTAFAAPVTLSAVELGPLRVERVPAFVLPEGRMRGSLLGMSFLNRLQEFSIQGDRLILSGSRGARS